MERRGRLGLDHDHVYSVNVGAHFGLSIGVREEGSVAEGRGVGGD